MAKYLSSNGSSSFAYNVENVDNTDYFAVICPASKEAEVSIRSKTLHMSTPKINAEQIDLQKISRTIEHLVNNDTMNSKMISNFQEIYQKLIVEKNSEYYLQLENIFKDYGIDSYPVFDSDYRLILLAHLLDFKNIKHIKIGLYEDKKVLLFKVGDKIRPVIKNTLVQLEKYSTGKFKEKILKLKKTLYI